MRLPRGRGPVPVALAVMLAVSGCANRCGGEPDSASVDAGPPRPTDDAAAAARAACAFTAGALPRDTLGRSQPVGADIPVDHVVLVMQENRAFDHYFSGLSHGGVDVPDAGWANPDALGNPVTSYQETHACVPDLPHGWSGSHRQWNNGANDGFVTTGGARAMGAYDESFLPFYYALARTFAISDRHFASLLGPTWPNRMYWLAGTSFGKVENLPPPETDPSGQYYSNLFYALHDADVEWRVYHASAPSALLFPTVYQDLSERFLPLEQYFVDAAAGTLPPVAWVEGVYLGDDRDDEHAPGSVQRGQAATARVVQALLESPLWPRAVMLLTYDEHGGFADHVPPPAACPPDGLLPELQPGDSPGAFDRLGFRVPVFAISPYARRGHVSHVVTDLTSITRFVEARFGLPALTARDANADALLDLFDFAHPDLSMPSLPAAVVDPVEDAYCEALWAGASP